MDQPHTNLDANRDDDPYPTGDTVPFPYGTPYPQQRDAMDCILKVLRKRDDELDRNSSDKSERKPAHLLFLESPTGTGKSLSLACATIAWLKWREKRDLTFSKNRDNVSSNHNDDVNEDVPAWVNAWSDRQREVKVRQKEEHELEVVNRAKEAREELNGALNLIRKELTKGLPVHARTEKDIESKLMVRRQNLARSAVNAAKIAERKGLRFMARKRARIDTNTGKATMHYESRSKRDDDFCVAEYYSDDDCYDENSADESSNIEDQTWSRGWKRRASSELLKGGHLDGSNASRKAPYFNPMKASDINASAVGRVSPGNGVRKIIYAARTHSQLSQFVREIKRTHWGKDIRVVALGGRKQLCGNIEVLGPSYRSEVAITERCLDITKKANSKSKINQNGGGCPLKVSKEGISSLSLQILATPSDIEDIRNLGKSSHACAYYATRESLAAAEVIVVPYSLLLSENAQNSIGLSLRNQVIIIDEAHNIPEALCAISSVTLTFMIVEAAISQVDEYSSRYSVRLAGRNLFFISQIRRCLKAFQSFLSKPNSQGPFTTTELIFSLKIENINISKLLFYLKKSKLTQKLLGFMKFRRDMEVANEDYTDKDESTTSDFISKHVSPLSLVENFLRCLVSGESDGKIFVDSRNNGTANFKFVLLDPSKRFNHVLRESHTVIFAGGTMRPFVHVVNEIVGSNKLLKDAVNADERINEIFSGTDQCSHTLFSESMTCFSCNHVVPSSHVNLIRLRSGPTQIKLDFKYTSRYNPHVCNELGRVLHDLCEIVPSGIVVFLPSFSYLTYVLKNWKLSSLMPCIERKKKIFFEPRTSREVDVILEAYGKETTDKSKCGAVLMCVIGAKMSEGINFSDDRCRCVLIAGLPYPDITSLELKEKMKQLDFNHKSSNGLGISGQKYYQNLCMRAINQSIGRAIRHASDYATIVLADNRYTTDDRVWKGLPEWVTKSCKEPINSCIEDKEFHQVLVTPTSKFFFDRKYLAQQSLGLMLGE